MAIDLYSIIVGFVVLSAFSSLYKHNPLFSIMEKIILGFGISQVILSNAYAVWDGQILKVPSGDPSYIIAIIIGLLYFTLFFRRLISVYRAILVITILAGIGVSVNMDLATLYSEVMYMVRITNINILAATIVAMAGLFYYIYGARTEAPLRLLRSVGRYAVFLFFGVALASEFFRYNNTVTGWFIYLVDTSGIYVLVAFAVGILVDVTIGWKKILGLEKPPTAKVEPLK